MVCELSTKVSRDVKSGYFDGTPQDWTAVGSVGELGAATASKRSWLDGGNRSSRGGMRSSLRSASSWVACASVGDVPEQLRSTVLRQGKLLQARLGIVDEGLEVQETEPVSPHLDHNHDHNADGTEGSTPGHEHSLASMPTSKPDAISNTTIGPRRATFHMGSTAGRRVHMDTGSIRPIRD